MFYRLFSRSVFTVITLLQTLKKKLLFLARHFYLFIYIICNTQLKKRHFNTIYFINNNLERSLWLLYDVDGDV